VKSDRPAQIERLLETIKESLKEKKYRITEHAIVRHKERSISLNDVLYVLKNGYHEKRKTSFDNKFKTWKYAIRGKTIENLDVRVIVAFVEEMIIITVINVGR